MTLCKTPATTPSGCACHPSKGGECTGTTVRGYLFNNPTIQPPQTLFTGSPILAGYQDGKTQRSHRGRIVMNKPKNEMSPKFTYLNALPLLSNPRCMNLILAWSLLLWACPKIRAMMPDTPSPAISFMPSLMIV